MQELLLSNPLMQWVEDGEKMGTSRMGRRDIQLDKLRLKATDGGMDDIIVEVVSVTYTKLENVPQSIIESEGYADLDELYGSLLNFYPDCTLDDEFTLIEWI